MFVCFCRITLMFILLHQVIYPSISITSPTIPTQGMLLLRCFIWETPHLLENTSRAPSTLLLIRRQTTNYVTEGRVTNSVFVCCRQQPLFWSAAVLFHSQRLVNSYSPSTNWCCMAVCLLCGPHECSCVDLSNLVAPTKLPGAVSTVTCVSTQSFY